MDDEHGSKPGNAKPTAMSGRSIRARRRHTALPMPTQSDAAERARRVAWQGAANQALQAKPRIGRSDDPTERQADRIADRVIDGESAASVAPAAVPTISPKHDAPTNTALAGGEALAAQAVSGQGTPLPPALRAYFEPRFGRDLSGVRLHLDGASNAAADAINARAYTLGSDIAFARDEYAPSTREGRRLVAHELAHVAQQGDPPVVRRAVRTDPRASLDNYFAGAGVTGITRNGNVYTRAKGGEASNVQSVLIPMLSSPRVFNIAGEDTMSAVSNLKDHVTARLGIVAFAAQKKYTFASVTGFKMNPQYYTWDTATMSWAIKPGANRQEAWNDLNVHPELYAIGCKAARDLTQAGGSGGSPFIDMPSSDEGDWVPGDAGYVKNTNFPQGKDIAYLGENIIYTGEGKFWGHLSDQNTYRTLDEWKKKVESWDGGSSVDTERELPTKGLA
ncbi:MAG: DUF4157 domain-containing protein [Alphaproteobacteria bacterium]